MFSYETPYRSNSLGPLNKRAVCITMVSNSKPHTARMNDDENIQKLIAAAASFTPANSDEVALYSSMLGALYALREARYLGYSDDLAKAQAPQAALRAASVAQSLVAGTKPDDAWLSGFYFNSALMRLSALNERLDTYAGFRRDSAAKVRKAVNALKHDVDAHLWSGWDMTFAEALTAAGALCEHLFSGRRDTGRRGGRQALQRLMK